MLVYRKAHPERSYKVRHFPYQNYKLYQVGSGLIESPSKFSFSERLKLLREHTNGRMGAGLTSAADRVSERLSPRLIISGGVARRLTRLIQHVAARRRRIWLSNKLLNLYLHLRGQ